ncbi:MAG: SulP family inorganic anion transporter [Solirubrobacterales bacterium]|nr:SulP family inorganic anion transporter [Solirubrobacterales bacterium]
MGTVLFPSLRGYRKGWLRNDLVSGLTVWAVRVPEALAYASIAGVSPVVGLYAAPAALIFYAAFGSSRQLIVGPGSATAALSAATIGDMVAPGSGAFLALTTTLAITTGMIALVAGFLRLGFLASFISEPVIKGFIIGLALTIIIGQVPGLLGMQGGSGEFFTKLWAVLTNLSTADGLTALIGILSLGFILGVKRVSRSVPGSLIVALVAIVLVTTLNLQDHGVAIVGAIDTGLPDFGTPDVPSGHWGDLMAGGFAMLLIAFAEGLGAAKTFAAKEHEQVDANKELIGLGAASLGAGLSGGMSVNGSLSKSAVNVDSGAKSQMSGLFVAALTILTILFLTGLFEDLPEATLAAIVIAAVIDLVDVPALIRFFKAPGRSDRARLGVAGRPDFIASVAAMLGVLVFDTLPGLIIGIIVSILLLVYRTSRPNIAVLGKAPGEGGQFNDIKRHPENRPVRGISVLRVEGGLFFANADTVTAEIRKRGSKEGVKAVIIDAETVPFIDISAMNALNDLAAEFSGEGKRPVMARNTGTVREELERSGSGYGWEVFPGVREAVDALTASGLG